MEKVSVSTLCTVKVYRRKWGYPYVRCWEHTAYIRATHAHVTGSEKTVLLYRKLVVGASA